MRTLSASLPRFNGGGHDDRFAEKEKLGRGRWQANGGNTWGNLASRFGRIFWRLRLRFALVLAFILCVIVFYATRKCCPHMNLLQSDESHLSQLYTTGTGGRPG